MKAVIMAGGEGVRMRPLALGLPKPMTPLLDKPVLAHLSALLRRCGITQIALTLQYMPQAITSCFGDGSEYGTALTYFTEPEPMGTAGSVRACMDWLGEEDFLVLSGDAVCALDLKAAMAFHAVHRSAATLVLCRHPAPLEYGLVLTDEEGRVERFIEKPAWSQVITNQINTGIYLLSRRAMELVPQGVPYDFAQDLFPALLAAGAPLYGYLAEGYWRDIGDCQAYLSCVSDVLAGRVNLELEAPKIAPGVWSASPLPASVQVIPPCYIGPNVSVGEGALLGPNTVLETGSTVGRFALVQQSVLQGAHAGDRTTLYGAILCRGAVAGRGAVLNEGTVLGENAVAGEDAVLMEGVKVWPNRWVSAGSRLTANLTAGGLRAPLRFDRGGVIYGRAGEDLTAELLLSLGSALGEAGRLVRRRAFETMCRENGGTKIATAHHRDDNAETVLLNMARGTGLRGLCGIRPVYGKWIRPLLCLTRQEIEEGLAEEGISWRTDATNEEDEYTRNRIRHRILPELERQVNAGTSRHLGELAEQAGEIWDYMQEQTDEAWKLCVKELPAGNRFIIEEEPFRTLAPALQKMLIHRCICRAAGRERDIESAHVNKVLDLFLRQTGRRLDLPGRVRALRTYGAVELQRISADAAREEGGKADADIPESARTGNPPMGKIPLQIPGETYFPETGERILCRFAEQADYIYAKEIPQKSYTKLIDYDIIKYSLSARTRQAGDYLTVDSRGNRQKLKSYFINEKVPREEREHKLLIADGRHIVWIPGMRMSSAYQVRKETGKILEIKITKEKNNGRTRRQRPASGHCSDQKNAYLDYW